MHKKISVIGAGGWGTALALLLAENRAQVRLWAHNPAVAEELVSSRTNGTYLPGVRLAPNIYATGKLADALDAELALIVTPSKAIREVALQIAQLNPDSRMVFVSCTKGSSTILGSL